MSASRVYFVYDSASQKAYIGKGPDGRIDSGHSTPYERLKKIGAREWQSAIFSTETDALIAEAAAIGICRNLGVELLNVQAGSSENFGPRFPFRYRAGSVTWKQAKRAIVVTITSDMLKNDKRVAPNSDWTDEEIAQRVRKYWRFGRERVVRWVAGQGAPEVLVAVLQANARILAAYRINNEGWLTDPENRKSIRAVPLVDTSRNDFKNMRGKLFDGDRSGGPFRYGDEVGQ